ncbi:hypothetical protein [Dactylosporangium darangshiense]|uniref:hypothetical protein n=1 Tax=Dactylosporangium darangshiense TaxID=579108 RepID=UPI0036278BB0
MPSSSIASISARGRHATIALAAGRRQGGVAPADHRAGQVVRGLAAGQAHDRGPVEAHQAHRLVELVADPGQDRAGHARGAVAGEVGAAGAQRPDPDREGLAVGVGVDPAAGDEPLEASTQDALG